MKHKRKQTQQEIFLKAFRKANREIELERNQGKWVSNHSVWKNKKKYDRKRDRKCYTDYPFCGFLCQESPFFPITNVVPSNSNVGKSFSTLII